MPDRSRIDGSPHPDPCTNTESGETATSFSAADAISAPEGLVAHTSGPVPLYLIAKAISTEVHEHGDRIVEVQIRRTRNHQYLITSLTIRDGGDVHA